MNKLVIALAAILIMPAAANAAPCRNAQGHFIKCAPAAAAPAARSAPVVHAAPAAHTPALHATAARAPAGRKAPCRDAKGRFKKC
jgi:hypothetical protein